MENGLSKWLFQENEQVLAASKISIRGVLYSLMDCLNKEDERETSLWGMETPRHSPASEPLLLQNKPSFMPSLLHDTTAIVQALAFFQQEGCQQAIHYILTVLARPNANILIPRPGFHGYESLAAFTGLEARHFDLLPKKSWEVDLQSVETLADENTVAIVIINPGNACGNVYTYHHLKQVAETARKLGIMVISDEVYAHLTFGPNPFVPMGAFASIVPVVTLGSISKRWLVPGWRLGWLVINDQNDILRKTGVVEYIKSFSTLMSEPATFIQGAIPELIEKTKGEFLTKTVELLKHTADICYERVKEIPCFICPYKPEGSMFVMVKLNLSLLEGIRDDMEFCVKLAKEESVIVLPGMAVGLKDWLRITFAIEPSALEDGLARIKAFCIRHKCNYKPAMSSSVD
ncbi:hypothetical protein L6164_018682 [Bauhinia variegata]|uniref:Uncharacterized protein n=1 Tax=Bauhinia variegata TaxID=167791 RepID=A0ACB9ND15_BAUVA|nr:hypothetical protein L6164_018682 [Bauhinia variegata]